MMAPLTISAADEKRVKALGFLSNKGTDNFSGRIITSRYREFRMTRLRISVHTLPRKAL